LESTEKKSFKAIKIGAIISYLALVLDVIAGLAYTPWIIKQIGESEYGLYTLATSLISMFMLDFGMSAAVSRYVSNYRAENNKKAIENFLGLTYKIYLVVSAIISVVLIFVYIYINQIYVKLTPTELDSLRIVYIIAGTSMIVCFPFVTLNGILNAYEEFAAMKLADVFNKVVTIILTIVALIGGLGLYTLVFINSFLNILTIVLKFILVKKKTKIKVNFVFYDKRLLKDITGFSLWTTVKSIAQRFIFNITPTILGVVSGSASITMFGLASVLEGYVFKFSQAINGMFMPKISRATLGSETGENILNLMIKVGRIVLSITGILIIGIVALGRDFINLWMGTEFSVVYMCTIFLILPSIIHLPQQVANTTVVVLNKVKIEGIVYVVMGLSNIVFSFILGRFWGEIGCSISICIAYFVRTILMNVVFVKELKINIFKFFKECHIKMAAGLILTLIVGFLIARFVNIYQGWINFGIKVICLTVSYIIIMWCIGWNKYEKDLILSFVRKVKK